MPVSVDQVLRRPVLVVPRLPGAEAVVERNRIVELELPTSLALRSRARPRTRTLACGRRRSSSPRLRISESQPADVRKRPQAVDAGVRPEIDQHDACHAASAIVSGFGVDPLCDAPELRRGTVVLQRAHTVARWPWARGRRWSSPSSRCAAAERSACPATTLASRESRSEGPGRRRRIASPRPRRAAPRPGGSTRPGPAAPWAARRPAKAPRASAAPRRGRRQRVSSTASTPTLRFFAATTATAASTGPAHGTKTRPRLAPSRKPPPRSPGPRRVSACSGRAISSPTCGRAG